MLIVLGVVLGALAARAALFVIGDEVKPVMLKLKGQAADCSWAEVFAIHGENVRFNERIRRLEATLAVKGRDEALGLELISFQGREYWIKDRGTEWSGKHLLAYLLSEHAWMAESNPANTVRDGDIVLDCGAHIGVFTTKALQFGAGTVVAIEPDPVNLECLRRNLAREITSGRVIVVPKGVWSGGGTLTLRESLFNSGSNSVVRKEKGHSIEVPVVTIDSLVRDLQLSRVNYIKMDIEGAEREALRGALTTLDKFRPRLMLDSYHLPDDPVVLPDIIRLAHRDYVITNGPCEYEGGRIVRHVTYYQ